ncbi:unnamed protein product [Mytilus edulis]|uniref:Uncharacterized protein n=1 Tax=Mytilus edulis TaxID=6550 RepID=A0A8S3PTH2_MYTED|nr:unnamed protein product [Mytilus edulis]
MLDQVLSKKKMALKELESITGLMAFCSRAIISARAFIRRFYDLIASVKNGKPYYTVRLNSEVKADARVWLNFLDQFNGQCYFPDRFWSTNESLELFTDSAGTTFYGLGPECRQFSSSNPTRIPVDDFRTEMNHLLINSLAPSTQKAYLHSMDIFVKFRENHGFSDVWPIPLDDLTSFIVLYV